jgi:hypothetical protein
MVLTFGELPSAIRTDSQHAAEVLTLLSRPYKITFRTGEVRRHSHIPPVLALHIGHFFDRSDRSRWNVAGPVAIADLGLVAARGAAESRARKCAGRRARPRLGGAACAAPPPAR